MKTKKTWRDKLQDSKDLPKTVPIPEKMRKNWGEGTLVIPAPLEVDEIMKKVPKGKLITINEIRAMLAERHGTTIACPLTTGIFARIAAEAANEEAVGGKKRITPYWRTLKAGGELNRKYPGGVEAQRALLESEGHRVIQKGKRFFVADYDKSLLRDTKTRH
ncbi:MAG: MGMT family protein [Deltaproteobacteria bacterium]|nr:MGMT family protein [Deltaproteobacteria bacterium]